LGRHIKRCHETVTWKDDDDDDDDDDEYPAVTGYVSYSRGSGVEFWAADPHSRLKILVSLFQLLQANSGIEP
jgi:hypothetical protein